MGTRTGPAHGNEDAESLFHVGALIIELGFCQIECGWIWPRQSLQLGPCQMTSQGAKPDVVYKVVCWPELLRCPPYADFVPWVCEFTRYVGMGTYSSAFIAWGDVLCCSLSLSIRRMDEALAREDMTSGDYIPGQWLYGLWREGGYLDCQHVIHPRKRPCLLTKTMIWSGIVHGPVRNEHYFVRCK